MTDWEPVYLKLLRSGELQKRVKTAYERLADCDLCGWECHVDRNERSGACKTGVEAIVASYGPHHGEEDPLRGWGGSGTIFFSWCNLRCQFCQNYDISQMGRGQSASPEQLAAMMLELQERGCHNINFVSPSHVVAQILAATLIAAQASSRACDELSRVGSARGAGLRLPLVYNTGGYDSPAALALLDGVIDIYMPDIKYADARVAKKYSKIPNYPAVNQAAVKEMHRQVGDLVLDDRGVARRGLLVRHLVMPGGLAGTAEIARFLAQEVSPDTFINVMGQYRPCYKAGHYPELDRPPTRQELEQAHQVARAAGLRRFDQRRANPLVWLLQD
jgi:putative pyruvate formate lyase activating enzyme